jgi:MinD superfamily P-loop ATPase
MIIAVASGKGGTGKTTVATGMTLALQDISSEVAFIDCDVEEPNGHIFLCPELNECEDVYIEVPEIDRQKCTRCGKCADLCAFNALLVTSDEVMVFPEFCHGCGGCRYFCPVEAVTMVPRKIGTVEKGYAGRVKFARGRLEVGAALSPPVVDAVKKHFTSQGITILDAPPGTSCPVIHTVRGSDFCLLVTEPTPFGLNDLDLAVQMVKSLGVPCGVLINRARERPCLIEKYCREHELNVLMKIPLSKDIAGAYSRGIPPGAVDGNWNKAFRQLYLDIGELVANEGNNRYQR